MKKQFVKYEISEVQRNFLRLAATQEKTLPKFWFVKLVNIRIKWDTLFYFHKIKVAGNDLIKSKIVDLRSTLLVTVLEVTLSVTSDEPWKVLVNLFPENLCDRVFNEVILINILFLTGGKGKISRATGKKVWKQ